MTSRVKFPFLTAVLFALSALTLTFAQHHTQTNLVADLPGVAAATDSNLINPWGTGAQHGLFGTLTAIAAEQDGDEE